MKRFTMQDLKSGHRVENRRGVRYVVLKDSYNGVMLFSDVCYSSAKYDNDLLCTSYSESDIMKVFLVDNSNEKDKTVQTTALLNSDGRILITDIRESD